MTGLYAITPDLSDSAALLRKVEAALEGGAPMSILGEAKRRPGLPVVAIGGITVDNAPQLIAAGADSVAVITALFGASDVKAAARLFSGIFSRST
jgi:thiamine monophosphate synthase